MTGEGGGNGRGVWGPRLSLGLLLLALAGFVDAVALLGFGLFASFMSGNTTRMSVAFAQGGAARGYAIAGAVVVFVSGAFLGRLLRLSTGRRSSVLLLEASLLAMAAGAARLGVEAGALALAVLAVGAQTAVLTRDGDAPISDTSVTGTLARLGSGLADALASEKGAPARTEWAASLLLWTALAAGAVGGAACFGRAGLGSLLFAAVACAALAAVAWLVEQRDTSRAHRMAS